MRETTTESSGEASSENNLGRSSTIKVLHDQSDRAKACCPAADARGGGARDLLARLAGAEAGLQNGRARSAVGNGSDAAA